MENPRLSNLFGALVVGIQAQLLHRIEADSSLGGQAAAALVTVGYNAGCSIDFLRGALHLSHSGCVRLVDKLAEAALMERRGGKDKRVIALFLTETGERRMQRILRVRRRCLEEVLEPLSVKESRQLTVLLEILLEKVTTSDEEAEAICRLCEEAVCPQLLCPVTQAAVAKSRS